MSGTKIFVCELLLEETRQALALEGLEDVEVHPYAVDLPSPEAWRDDLKARMLQVRGAGDILIVLGSEWAPSPGIGCQDEGVTFVHADACHDYLAGPGLLEQLASDRSLIVFPGTVRRWKRMIKARPLPSGEGAETSHPSIVYLDTGVDQGARKELEELSAFLGKPYLTVTVGLDFLRLYLAKLVLEARLEREVCRAQQEWRVQARLRSEYAMAFDLLQRMGQGIEEEAVVGSLMDILHMLFSPAESDYYAIDPEGRVKVFDYSSGRLVRAEGADIEALLSTSDVWEEASGGFKLKVQDKGRPLGVAVLRRLCHPENRKEYVNLASQLAVVFGLALANARSYRSLTDTETKVERAFALEKTMLEISQGLFARQDYDRAVLDSLARVGEAVGASRALLLQFSGDMRALSTTYEWDRPGVAPAKDALSSIPMVAQSWLSDLVRAEGTVRTVDLSKAEGEAKAQLEPFIRSGATAMALASVVVERRQQGMVCLQHVEGGKGFEADETNLLRFLAQTLSMALQRRKNQEDLARLAESVGMSNKVLRHDIRNELMVLTGSLQLYEMKNDPKHLDRAKRSASRLTEILDHFKELDSFLQSSEGLFPVELADAIRLAMAPHQLYYHVEGQGSVMADYAINSVLDNLARNAIKHGRADGINFTIRRSGPFVELLVADDGKGIPKEAKDRLFQEGFSYGEVRGTGLGLFWIRKTLERYGGWAKLLESEKGATFSLGFLSP